MFHKSAKVLFIAAKVAGIALLLLMDPFGLTSASDEASSDSANMVMSLSYPDTGQKKVTVVLIDDKYLIDNQLHWPLAYSEQAKIFRQVLNYRPQALFIDLLYTYDRSTKDDEFGRINATFSRFQQAFNIPIYLARPDTELINIPPDLFNYAKPVAVKWEGHGDYYPRVQSELPTPAQALYQAYCNDGDCNSEVSEDIPIAVQWGADVSPLQGELTRYDNCNDTRNSWEVLEILLSQIFHKVGDQWRQPCIYTKTVYASQLAANDDEGRRILKEFLTDSLVLIGASLGGIQDYVVSPVHGSVPGVYFHAMALDNLLTYQGSYFREPPVLIGNIGVADITGLFFLSLIVIRRHLKNGFPSQRKSVGVSKFARFMSSFSAVVEQYFMLIWTVALMLVMWLFALVWHYEPVNWLGLVTLAFVILIDEKDILSLWGRKIRPFVFGFFLVGKRLFNFDK